jgi:putative DNA methylase
LTPHDQAMKYPRRLIEVDLPIKEISAHARREKSIRHGHISTLHIWWARRPLAACRAVILAALWPDPADALCPERFRGEAAKAMREFRDRCGGKPRDWSDPIQVRGALLDFIAEFANWDNSTNTAYLETSRRLVQVAHESLGGSPGTRPLVVDPFAGGGAIPLEALRVGADAFASDLNPIAVLLNKVVLEYIPKHGSRLAEEVRRWGVWVKEQAEKELARFYPSDRDGAVPIAYLWARTIRCEGPACGAEVPLVRSLLLARRGTRSTSLALTTNPRSKTIDFQVVDGPARPGTIRRGAATCPICDYTTPNGRVRAQLAERRSGISDARLLAVVTSRSAEQGRFYRVATNTDLVAVRAAANELQRRASAKRETSLVPDELIPPERPSPNARGLSAVTRMGARTFGDLFTPRQSLTISTFARLIGEVKDEITTATDDEALAEAVQIILALGLDRLVDRNSTLCRWDPTPTASGIINTFSRQALPIMWDFAEGLPFENKSGGWLPALEWTALVIEREAKRRSNGAHAEQASATSHPLPDDSAQALITDPPYYDAIPYGDLSDFFYVWLRRSLPQFRTTIFGEATTPKDEEAIWNPGRKHSVTGKPKDTAFYEAQMARALAEGRRITAPNGVGVVVFAHKSTAGWEAILSALLNAGWITTASWPVDTEMGSRMNAMGTASLASSVHIVCRPRENPDGSVKTDAIGDWRAVLRELPTRIHQWMPRLAKEGVVGADAIFACLGPALEIFSRYSRVEKASGERVELREYLEQVWAAVAREALSMIFEDADATGLEEDARLTAMWLWTLSASANGGDGGSSTAGDDEAGAGSEDEEEEGTGRAKPSAGFSLEFDAARKIAQGLGAHLEDLGRVIEIKGDQARLLSVAERTRHLFGKDHPQRAPARRAKKMVQLTLFDELEAAEKDAGWGDVGLPPAGETTLDRVHQAMILFAAGRGEALKRFLVEEGIGRDARFWKLAQSFSALYPGGTDEKRWVDGVLARKKGLGFG